MSDEGARFATPIAVLTVGSPEQARDEVLAIIRKEGVERIVVGVPINMDESIGPAAQTAIKWARELSALAQKPLVLIDERLSSFGPEARSLTDRKRGGEKMTRKDRKERLDAIAAAGFLQQFLDGRLPALELP